LEAFFYRRICRPFTSWKARSDGSQDTRIATPHEVEEKEDEREDKAELGEDPSKASEVKEEVIKEVVIKALAEFTVDSVKEGKAEEIKALEAHRAASVDPNKDLAVLSKASGVNKPTMNALIMNELSVISIVMKMETTGIMEYRSDKDQEDLLLEAMEASWELVHHVVKDKEEAMAALAGLQHRELKDKGKEVEVEADDIALLLLCRPMLL